MAESATDPRATRALERDLHRRLLARDPVAPSELAVGYLEPLIARLRARFPRLDPDMVESAAADSILGLAERPKRYDPDRLGLLAYLVMDADGDLRHARERAWREAKRQVPLVEEPVDQDVEDRSPRRNLPRDESDNPLEELLRREDDAYPAWFRAAYAELDERERRVVDLMLERERRTAAFARVIGAEHLPRGEQEREVKRWKDRLVKRLRRRRDAEGR